MEMSTVIATVATDVKWIKEDAESRNGRIDDHIKESDTFRKQVTRNTVWRYVFKISTGGIFVIIIWMLKLHITK